MWREIGALDVREHLGNAEQAHHHRHEADAVVELDALEGQARLRGDRVEADEAEHGADAGHEQRLRHRALRQEGENA